MSSGVLGNSIDIHVGKNDCSAEIRADIKVDEFSSKRIWGQVVNCNGRPVGNSLVKLVRVVCKGNKKYYQGVAHTVTDCEGFYQFDVCNNDDNECYKIIINKAVTGQELVIDTNGGNCYACSDFNCGNSGYNPCPPYSPITKNYDRNECNCNTNPCGTPNPCISNNCNDYYEVIPCEQNNNCNSNKPKTNYATYTR